MSRDFDLSDILSITTDALVSSRHIDGVYDILNFMTGDDLFTHQLPRASIMCKPALLAQHPQLAEIVFPTAEMDGIVAVLPFDVNEREARQAFVADWIKAQADRLGAVTLPVTPLDEWHSMNPIQELAEMTERPDKIIVVET